MAKKGENGYWTMDDHNTLIEIKTKLDILMKDFTSHIISINRDIVRVENKVTELEKIRTEYDPAKILPKFETMLGEWNIFHEKLPSRTAAIDDWIKFRERLKVWGLIIILGGGLVGALIKAFINFLAGHSVF